MAITDGFNYSTTRMMNKYLEGKTQMLYPEGEWAGDSLVSHLVLCSHLTCSHLTCSHLVGKQDELARQSLPVCMSPAALQFRPSRVTSLCDALDVCPGAAPGSLLVLEVQFVQNFRTER